MGTAASPRAAAPLDAGSAVLDAGAPVPMLVDSEETLPAATEELEPIVAPGPVVFDPPARGFRESLSLELRATPDSVVHYTLDGSLPSEESPVADGLIELDQSALVRARAVRAGLPGPVVSQSYFKLDASLDAFRSNLPVIIAHTLGEEAPAAKSRKYVPGMFGLFEPEAGRTALDAPATHTSRFGIKVRGRITRYQPKPSYTIELWGQDREDAPAALLGMPADGDWVLYAPFDIDRSYVRNAFAYEISRRVGRYAPRTRFVELFVVADHQDVTASDYRGVFVLTERVKRAPERVAIEKLHDDDLSEQAIRGGYLLNVDQPDGPDESFRIGEREFVFVDPDPDEIAPAQRAYIQRYVESVTRALWQPDGRDPETGTHFSELIDVDSFIDYHVLTLLMKNVDGFILSSYLHKSRAGKLQAGPLWDFDLSMGSYDGLERCLDPDDWGGDLFNRSFWTPLFDHAEVMDAYWARWRALLTGPLQSEQFAALIDGYADELREASVRDRARWQSLYGETSPLRPPAPLSFDEEIAFLKTWLARRVRYIDEHLGVRPY